jgi:hypothetical protein
MATVMIKGRFEVIQETESGKKKADMSEIWSCKLHNANDLEKQNGTYGEYRDFENLNEVMMSPLLKWVQQHRSDNVQSSFLFFLGFNFS